MKNKGDDSNFNTGLAQLDRSPQFSPVGSVVECIQPGMARRWNFGTISVIGRCFDELIAVRILKRQRRD
jgi:hypothetical protein